MSKSHSPSYKFISYPYRCELGSSPNAKVEYSIEDKDLSLDDMLESFQYFLKAAGYQFDIGARIAVVDDMRSDGTQSAMDLCDVIEIDNEFSGAYMSMADDINGTQDASPYDIPEVNVDRLIRNSFSTPDGTVLISRSRHDYQTHTDANGKWYMIDGGLDYLKRTGEDDQVDLTMWDIEPHSVQREVLQWGTFGINGDQPLMYINIADMSSDHIGAVLDTCRPDYVIKKCMEVELFIRGLEPDGAL